MSSAGIRNKWNVGHLATFWALLPEKRVKSGTSRYGNYSEDLSVSFVCICTSMCDVRQRYATYTPHFTGSVEYENQKSH